MYGAEPGEPEAARAPDWVVVVLALPRRLLDKALSG
jgi:hypothetical protein